MVAVERGSVEDFFHDAPLGRSVYDELVRLVDGLGPATARITKSQVAFRRRGGFCWVWLPPMYLSHPGADVVVSVALDRPDRVTHVATLCSAAKFGTAEAWQERAALVRAEGMTPMLESTPARWFGPAIRSADDGDARMQAILTDLAAVDAQSYARVCEAIGSHDVRDRLTSLTAPLLAVAGAEDIATPPSVMQEIVDGVPNGRLEVLPGVAHLAPYEDPAGTADLLRAFLAG